MVCRSIFKGKICLLLVLVMASKFCYGNEMSVTVTPEASLSGIPLFPSSVDLGVEHLKNKTAQDSSFTMLFDPFAEGEVATQVTYSVGDGVSNLGFCQIRTAVRSLNYFPFNNQQTVGLTTNSEFPNDLVCTPVLDPGAIVMNQFSLGTAITVFSATAVFAILANSLNTYLLYYATKKLLGPGYALFNFVPYIGMPIIESAAARNIKSYKQDMFYSLFVKKIFELNVGFLFFDTVNMRESPSKIYAQKFLQKGSSYVLFPLSFATLVGWLVTNKTLNYSGAVSIRQIPPTSPVSEVFEVRQTPTGGSFLSVERGEGESDGVTTVALSVPTGEELVLVAKENSADSFHNPFLYRVEDILSGEPTKGPKGCAVNMGEDSSLSTILFPTDNGATVAQFDSNANVTGYKHLFVGKRVETAELFQETGTNRCLAFIQTSHTTKNPQTGEDEVVRGFYASGFSSPSLSPLVTQESDFFELKAEKMAFDGKGKTFLAVDGHASVVVLDALTNEVSSAQGLPESSQVKSLYSLPNNRVLAVTHGGESFMADRNGVFAPVDTLGVNLSQFDFLRVVSWPSSESASGELSEGSVVLFSPADPVGQGKAGVFGGFLVKLASESAEHPFLQVQPLASDRVVIDYAEGASLVSLLAQDKLATENPVEHVETYFLNPKDIRWEDVLFASEQGSVFSAGSVDSLLGSPLTGLTPKPDPLQGDSVFFYARKGSNVLSRYEAGQGDAVIFDSGFEEEGLSENPAEGIVLFPLWETKAFLALKGERLRLKDASGAPLSLQNGKGEEVEEYQFAAPVEGLLTVDVLAKGKKVPALIFTTKQGGLHVFVPELGSAGQVLANTYRPVLHLFDGFHFTEVEVKDNILTLHDPEYGSFQASAFPLDENDISLLSEDRFEFLEQ